METKIIATSNAERLGTIDYPGRLIITGVTPSRKNIVQLYCTMGRSDNSKNRKLIEMDGHIKTVPIDSSVEMKNTSLLIYDVAYQIGSSYIVGNGEQTDTIAEYISNGRSFSDALYEWKHEFDAPIFTPRISGIVSLDCENKTYVYELSIIKAVEHTSQESKHYIFRYNCTESGIAHCIHTYSPEGLCLPFHGEPYLVPLFETPEQNLNYYWDLMPEDKKIGMYVRVIDINTGKSTYKIINKRVG